jgi:hypothetical protein
MATINLGNLTFTHKGDYAGGTAYVKNDVVYYATNGNSYIAKTSTTGNAPTSTTHWDLFVAGSSGIWNAGLSLGSAGQAVKVNAAGNALEFGTISSGTYSVHRIDSYSNNTSVSHSSTNADYLDIANGGTVNFTPTSTDDFVFFTHYCALQWGNYIEGADVYLIMKASSSSIGSGDTKLNYNGEHATYYNQLNDNYTQVSKQIMVPCTSLSVGTTYYVEQAGANHNGNSIAYNSQASSGTGYVSGMDRHHVTMIHYKKN